MLRHIMMSVLAFSLILAADPAHAGEPLQPGAAGQPSAANGLAKQAQYEGLVKQGQAARAAKDYPRAIGFFEKAAELVPTDPGAAYNLASLHALAGQKPEALECLDRAISHGFLNAEHIQKDADLAAIHGEARFAELVARARTLATAVAKSRYAPDAFSDAGVKALDANDTKQAIALLSKAYELAPQNPYVIYNLACAYGIAGQRDKAFELFKKARELDPLNSDIAYNLACHYALVGQKAEALQCLDRAVKSGFLDAEHIQKDTDLASLHGEQRFKELVAEAQTLQALLTLAPAEDAKARHAQCEALLKQGGDAWKAKDSQKTFELFTKAFELAPDDANIAYNLACVYALAGRKAEALDYLEKAIERGTLNVAEIQADADLAAVREEPRFKELTARAQTFMQTAVDLLYVQTASRASVGAGVVVHEAGYILTAHHAVTDDKGTFAVLYGGRRFPYRIIATLPETDAALLKIDADKPLQAAKIGRSSGVALGDRTILVGNPLGKAHSVTGGLVSALGRACNLDPSVPRGAPWREGMIQANFAAQHGYSGGPLFTMAGEVIGILTASAPDVRIPSYSVPVDPICERLAKALVPERIAGLRLGLEVDPLGPARVAAIAPGSPADKAGIKVGDVMLKVAGRPADNAIQFYLSVAERKKGGPAAMELQRGDKTIAVDVVLEETPARPAEGDIPGLVSGLKCKVYAGQWTKLPDFDTLKEVATETVQSISASVPSAKENFGLQFEGYIQVLADGVYLFSNVTGSRFDGSRLWIGDTLVVDNDRDGALGGVTHTGFIRLKAGKHPIKIAYFHDGKEKGVLRACYEGPSTPRQQISANALLCKP